MGIIHVSWHNCGSNIFISCVVSLSNLSLFEDFASIHVLFALAKLDFLCLFSVLSIVS